MIRCDECKYKGNCVCVPYGCECFELDLEKHDKQIRSDAIDDCLKVIRKGMEELLRSPWANKKYLREFYLSVEEVFEVIEHLILKKDIEQLKEQK